MDKSRRLKKNIYFLTLLSFALGFFVMVSIHTNRASQITDAKNTADIIAYIEEKEAKNTQLEQNIAEVRNQIEAIRSSQAESTQTSSQLTDTLSRLNQLAGLTSLSGSGIVVTLNDNSVGAELAQKTNPATYNAENYIIHDKDILYLLRAVAPYAEAVSINGVRIIDTTSIRCVGTVIMVNSNRLAPPYEITFIGDADQLEEAVYSSARYYRLTYMSMPVSVTRADNLVVPAYTGSYKPVFASLVPTVDKENIEDSEE